MIHGRDRLQRHHLASCARDLTTRSRATPPSPTSPDFAGRPTARATSISAYCRFAHSTVRVRSVQWWKKKNGSYLGVVGANFLEDKCEYRLAKGFNECRFVDATARLV
ncbi:hypothetical protein ALC56_04742 [Trachymyrmex septentrionalis]|uniref:Uncharacterized protein n=1 Tax=Trachymyrmex septentrionalis TaxID=34720 RepID=A0A195FKG7_9HYME|nr:hypothetical protein ALC56_04742 [Trachymyrmex septentrionalis]